ncbi:hypothetical protein M0805_002716 [Coniferiporia weirii]|nr:hypothetical protein M0805_002716 [Coniferiporia weirii]
MVLRETMGWREHAFERVGGSDEVDCLGSKQEMEPDDTTGLPRCFNCGLTSHAVRSCSQPLNHALIALSRALFQFYRQSTDAEPGRIHVSEERKMVRLRWLDEFSPGEVRGSLLRDALGLKDGDLGENAPWLHNMLEWGYPPGWMGPNDPTKLMLSRIVSDGNFDSKGDELGDFVVFGDGGDVETLQLRSRSVGQSLTDDDQISASSSMRPSSGNTGDSAAQPEESKRWAMYRTSLFSSALLPIYAGRALPPLDDDPSIGRGTVQDRTHIPGPPNSHGSTLEKKDANRTIGHPWRHPDAFSAFGPVGWTEAYARAYAGRTAQVAVWQAGCDKSGGGTLDDAAESFKAAKVTAYSLSRDDDTEASDADMDMSE